jgi:excisionase family DNA binding protein
VGQSKRSVSAAPVRDLTSHQKQFVTEADLAHYWGVSRRHIHKQIEQGDLPAMRLGPRSIRVATRDAIDFEQRRIFTPAERRDDSRRAVEHMDRPASSPDTQRRPRY